MPLAALKQGIPMFIGQTQRVATDLVPLAALKLHCKTIGANTVVATDLVPLAALKLPDIK